MLCFHLPTDSSYTDAFDRVRPDTMWDCSGRESSRACSSSFCPASTWTCSRPRSPPPVSTPWRRQKASVSKFWRRYVQHGQDENSVSGNYHKNSQNFVCFSILGHKTQNFSANFARVSLSSLPSPSSTLNHCIVCPGIRCCCCCRKNNKPKKFRIINKLPLLGN